MKKFSIVILLTFLAGCATVSSVNKNNAALDPGDGINVKEAVAIAQKYCLDNAECKGDVRISTPEVVDLSDRWSVNFGSKNIFALDHTYVVAVDKQSGKVLSGKVTR